MTDTVAVVGQPFTRQIHAWDPDGDELTYTVLEEWANPLSPYNVSVDSLAGIISFTPQEDHIGDSTIRLQLYDRRGGVTDSSFVVSVIEQMPDSITILTTSLNFDSVLVGDSDTLSFTIQNSSSDSIEVALSSPSNPFDLDSSAITVLSLDSAVVTITFSPTADSAYSDSIIVSTADTSIVVSLAGQGYSIQPKIFGTVYVSKSGDDDTVDGTEFNPYLTINRGYQVINPGDTLFVDTGIYEEILTLDKNRMVLKGLSADSVTIEPHTPGGSSAITVNVIGDSITVKDVLVKGGGHSINVTGYYNIIEDNIIINTSNFLGILVHSSADSIFIQNNIFLQSAYYDSYVSVSVAQNSIVLISHNTFVGDKVGIAVSNGSIGGTIKNNIIMNYDKAINSSSTGNVEISHNDLYNNNTNYSLNEGGTFSPILGTGEISSDPLFHGEFVPALNSPVLGAGENGTNIGATPTIQGIPEYSLTDYFLNSKGLFDGQYFGGINTNDTEELSFSIENHRNSPFVITSIYNFSSDAFNVIEPESFPQTIPVDDSLTFTIEFSPNEARHFSNPFDATLSVFTDDVSDAIFNVLLFGISQERALMDSLKILTDSLVFAVEDEPYADTVFTTLNDSIGTTVQFSLVVGPQWLSITTIDSLGLLSGTPTNDDVGQDILITITAFDSVNQFTDSLVTTIDVINVNDAPVVLNTSLNDALMNTFYLDTIYVEDVDVSDSVFTFTLLEGPEWLSLDSLGVVSGTPAFTDTGSSSISIRVADPDDLPDTLDTIVNVLLSSHFAYTTHTGQSYSIVIDTVDFNDLDIGDEIAVFDNDLVVGATIFDGSFPIGLTAWKDDPQTAETDGYKKGGLMLFKVYDTATDNELWAEPYSILEGDGDFETGGFAQLSLAIELRGEQTISLVQGWNLISSYLLPDTLDIDNITNGIGDNLAIMKNDRGRFYIPGLFDGIKEWDITDGYKMYMNETDSLEISGTTINLSTQIHLLPKWNYIPVYFREPSPITSAYSSLEDRLIIVQNNDGEFYVPDLINSIEDLIPGQGYSIYMKSSRKFSYSETAKIAAPRIIAENGINSMYKNAIQETIFNDRPFYTFAARTGDTYSILINAAEINGVSIESGDEIGMFDVTAEGDTINIGARVFEGEFPLDLWAWMDDSQTDIQDGYIEGNDILFRIWDTSERIEYFASAEYLQGDGTYGDGLFTQISNIQTVSTVIKAETVAIVTEPDSVELVTVPTDSAIVMLTFSNETSLALDFKEGEVANRKLKVKQVKIITEEFPDVPVFEKVVFYYDIELDVEDFQVELTFGYSDDMITGLGLNEDSLAISYYDTIEVRWRIVTGTVDKFNNKINVNTNHFSLWALTSSSEELITSVDHVNRFVPTQFELRQNYPNPFNPTTTITFSQPSTSLITLKIYNVLGREIATLADETFSQGIHYIEWNGRDSNGIPVGSGVYFYVLRSSSGFFDSNKMLFIK